MQAISSKFSLNRLIIPPEISVLLSVEVAKRFTHFGLVFRDKNIDRSSKVMFRETKLSYLVGRTSLALAAQ